MDLKSRFKNKQTIKKILVWALVAVLGGCLIKVAVWEQAYYARMEGTERAVSPSTGSLALPEEVDETDVTEEDKLEYIVAADRPRYLSIEKLGIQNARVLALGVSTAGQLQTPVSIFDVGWYQKSGKPGTGGTGLYDGHNGGPSKVGVFKRLNTLVPGDAITIELGSGTRLTYLVYDNRTIPLAEADAHMAEMEVSPVPGTESISIITCTGEWSDKQKTYLSRQFLRAVIPVE